MCFGGGGSAPKAPKIKYEGPSKADIRRNEQELQQYQNQMTEQQNQFQAQLQAQIDRADQEYADLESQYSAQLAEQEKAQQAARAEQEAALAQANTALQEAQSAAGAAAREQQNAKAALSGAKEAAAGDLNAAAAQGAMAQNNAYSVAVKESDPVNAQETKAITDKKKPKSTLKISQNAVEAAAGTGLNIGV